MGGLADWFASSWDTLAFIAAGSAAIYLSVLVGVRLAGRRTVAESSTFDFIITIAIGSLLASTATQQRPTIAEGATALAALLTMQVLIALLRRRSSRLRRLIEFPPQVIVYRGEIQIDAMRPPRMTREEVLAKLRQKGAFRLEDVEIAIREPTGDISVLLRSNAPGVVADEVRRRLA